MGLTPKNYNQDVVCWALSSPRWAPLLFSASAISKMGLEYQSVKINGKRHQALVDNQASLNIMSVDFAEREGLVIRTDNTAFRLTNGSICFAVARVRIHYQLTRGSQYLRKLEGHQDFYVLPWVITPLVLGLPFLQETNSLLGPTYSPQPLRHTSLRSPSTPLITIPRYARACLKVYLADNTTRVEAIAMPDKGASSNMISWHCAKAAGYPLDRSFKSQLPFTMGNGHTIFALGKVRAKLLFCEKAPLLHEISVTFSVIDGLPVDLVLSNHFLRKYRIFETNQLHLQWLLVEDTIPSFQCAPGGRYPKNPKGNSVQIQDVNQKPKDQIQIDTRCNKFSSGELKPGAYERREKLLIASRHEAKAKKEAEEKARAEAEEKARKEAEEKKKQEAEAEAEEKTKQEAEKEAKAEEKAERKVKEEEKVK